MVTGRDEAGVVDAEAAPGTDDQLPDGAGWAVAEGPAAKAVLDRAGRTRGLAEVAEEPLEPRWVHGQLPSHRRERVAEVRGLEVGSANEHSIGRQEDR